MTHETYFLEFNTSRILNRYRLLDGEWKFTRTFKQPLSSAGPKVYVFSSRKEIFYIGKTTQSIGLRFGAAFKASIEKRHGGFKGYAFKNHIQFAHLHVFTSDKWNLKDLDDAELIEAEIAFHYRMTSGKWPRFQNEIHFGSHTKKHSNAAARMYSKITEEWQHMPRNPKLHSKAILTAQAKELNF